MNKQLSILGIRGLPAAHGGFETFAERLAIHLNARGWSIDVYCQEKKGAYAGEAETRWNGIRRIHIPVSGDGAVSTIRFDWLSCMKASRRPGLILTLGYNTALFNALYRLAGKPNVINMDGIEWKRKKWKLHEKAWLFLNERAGSLLGNHLIADHPRIAAHLETMAPSSKITMIPYGADEVSAADAALLEPLGLIPGSYVLVIARPEPENHVLEVVQAFCREPRDVRLVVLGSFHEDNAYHQATLRAANENVLFPGAIYDKDTVKALRFHALLYVHGHSVGGTNPSLVEALGAGQPVLAHDNEYNRWVAGKDAAYFKTVEECSERLTSLLGSPERLKQMSAYSRERFRETFKWEDILEQYEHLLERWIPDRT